MRVLATAGHVDHGKSTLVRALTGMEPDRWAEERRRGMTIDLGYAWTQLPSGEEIAFVDVPGHQRFIANMLAGLGPAPAVLFVVAADEGWARQSEEHLAAADALGIEHALLAVTRSDLADPAGAIEQARARLAGSSLGTVEAVAVSAATGAGLDELRAALQRLVDRLPVPDPDAPARLWIDRAFTVRGSGTVVTGTLGTGRIEVDDVLELRGRPLTVRGIQCLGSARRRVEGPARVALNLRGIRLDEVARGDAVLAPKAWHHAAQVDARLRVRPGEPLPAQQMLHFGTAAVPVRVRVLGDDGDDVLARLQLDGAVPIRAGDRAVLRDPGRQTVAAGVTVLDADPPPLTRRGAAAVRAAELVAFDAEVDPIREIARRGAMQHAKLAELGGRVPEGVREIDGWLLDESAWQRWSAAAVRAVETWAQRDALEPAMPLAALRRALDVPTDAIAAAVATAAGLPVRDGRVHASTGPRSLGAAESGLRRLEARLQLDPFAAPLKDELTELGLGRRELAAAERSARVLRLGEHIVLAPSAPAEAARRLAALPQPFTASEAGAVLGTSRRVTIPLLELLDAQGATERLDDGLRLIRPAHGPT